MELSPVIGKEAIPSEGTNLSKKHVIEPIQSLGTARSERLVAYKGEAEVEEIGLPAYLSLCFHLIHISFANNIYGHIRFMLYFNRC